MEIDENLKRHDLTVWEAAKHVARREEILEERGQRRTVGGRVHPATVTGSNTTANLAEEMG